MRKEERNRMQSKTQNENAEHKSNSLECLKQYKKVSYNIKESRSYKKNNLWKIHNPLWRLIWAMRYTPLRVRLASVTGIDRFSSSVPVRRCNYRKTVDGLVDRRRKYPWIPSLRTNTRNPIVVGLHDPRIYLSSLFLPRFLSSARHVRKEPFSVTAITWLPFSWTSRITLIEIYATWVERMLKSLVGYLFACLTSLFFSVSHIYQNVLSFSLHFSLLFFNHPFLYFFVFLYF